MIVWGRRFVAAKVDGFQTGRVPAKADSRQVLAFRLRGLHRRNNSLQLYKRSKLRNVALGISRGFKKGYPHSVSPANRKNTAGLQLERPVGSYFKLYRRNCLSKYVHCTSREFVEYKFLCQNLCCNRAAYFPVFAVIILEFLVLYLCLYNVNLPFLRINRLE